ncbi:2-amino-4-hydroxy-6-hydroxymethyldihydropteridine diphosphokinase [Paludibacterium denitrificans]|uniref:2-amino-4-hydroxy-6-hydroxymethyldihydropteridine pyrophosphokinase n=1 Tax=Paludibacterium denitrificans TaxID=2675226 RepID=A0A844GCI5_9NEIS|nr:2-amino-4-hydroxy-6-hydroxymethyldihydropteridine diphosphokinase [Paludibacterium denitrificans]MTD32484.1 2-amino-4-hydroxy-6-hydroxymethyldihydropteridine diphosphokinase [Paludibacterium denitrificans]
MTRAYVALGSNLERPSEQIRAAFAAPAALDGTRVVRQSSLYKTTPVGYLDQPDFINAVAELDTSLTPLALLQALMQIETGFGRVRTFRNAPRVLDLDVLHVDGCQMQTETLTLPHPRLHERAFVLVPLAEIAPELLVAGDIPVREAVKRLDVSGVMRLPDGDDRHAM